MKGPKIAVDQSSIHSGGTLEFPKAVPRRMSVRRQLKHNGKIIISKSLSW